MYYTHKMTWPRSALCFSGPLHRMVACIYCRRSSRVTLELSNLESMQPCTAVQSAEAGHHIRTWTSGLITRTLKERWAATQSLYMSQHDTRQPVRLYESIAVFIAKLVSLLSINIPAQTPAHKSTHTVKKLALSSWFVSYYPCKLTVVYI